MPAPITAVVGRSLAPGTSATLADGLTNVDFFRHLSKLASSVYRDPMAKTLRCPCGTVINAADDDELVALTQEHLAAEHPGREYTRDEILFMAAW